MNNRVISLNNSSFHRILRGGQKVTVFTRSEQWESGTVATFITSIEDTTTGEDITADFSEKEKNDLLWETLVFTHTK